MNRGIINLFTIIGSSLLSFSASAVIPEGYYSRLEGLSGVTLKKAVKAAARNHTAISYGTSTWEVFMESDTRVIGGQKYWWDMYLDNNVPATSASAPSSMNIEHGVPNSWWGKTKNDAYKDIFHLNPSDKDANSSKSNFPLGITSSDPKKTGVVGKPTAGTGDDASRVYEPADEYKGDFARAYFYMFTIYDDIAWTSNWDWMYNTSSDLLLRPWAYQMLLQWAKDDPVSQKEIERNEAIYKYQKNRNPFIDYPELADHIWGSKSNQPFHLDNSSNSSGGNDNSDNNDNDNGSGENSSENTGEEGNWYAVTNSSDLNENDKYIIVCLSEKEAMSTTYARNNYVSYFLPCKSKLTFNETVNPPILTSLPEDVAIIRLTKSGNKWLMAVEAQDGTQFGYFKSSVGKEASLTNDMTDNGCLTEIIPTSTSTIIRYVYSDSSQSFNLQYNNIDGANRFTTYSSTQQPIILYKQTEQQNDNNPGAAGLSTGTYETEGEIISGIYDINGRRLKSLELSDLKAGIYIVVSNFGVKKIMK